MESLGRDSTVRCLPFNRGSTQHRVTGTDLQLHEYIVLSCSVVILRSKESLRGQTIESMVLMARIRQQLLVNVFARRPWAGYKASLFLL